MTTGELQTLVERIRAKYVDQQFVYVVRQRLAANGGGTAEVKFADIAGVYKGLSAVDWLEPGPAMKVDFIVSSTYLKFAAPIHFGLEGMTVDMSPFAWDSVRFSFDTTRIDRVGFEKWFDYWFDIDDERYIEGRDVGDIIHLARIDGSGVFVDFGSAPTDAFWSLLALIARSGTSTLQIGMDE